MTSQNFQERGTIHDIPLDDSPGRDTSAAWFAEDGHSALLKSLVPITHGWPNTDAPQKSVFPLYVLVPQLQHGESQNGLGWKGP